MTHRKALARISINTICMYTAWAVRKFSALALAVVVARVAGLPDFGLYCLALVWMEAGIRLAVFGTDILVVRDLSAARPGAADLAGQALAWRASVAILLYPLLVLLAHQFNRDTLLPVVVTAMGIGMIAQTTANLYLALLQGRERVDLHALTQAATSLFGLVLGIVAVVEGYGLPGLAFAYSVRSLFCLLLSTGLCRRLGLAARPRFEPAAWRRMLHRAAPIGANRLVTVLYLASGLTLLQWIHGQTAVGLFAAAMRIFETCSAFGTMTMVAAFPTIARLQAVSRDGLRRTVAAIVRLFCWAGIPLSILVAVAARPLLTLFFGRPAAAGAPALVLLMAAIPFSLHSELAERLAYAHEDQRKVVFIRTAGFTLNVLVLFCVTGPLGYLAPALGILAAEVVMLTLFLPVWMHYLPPGAPAPLPRDPLAWRPVRPGTTLRPPLGHGRNPRGDPSADERRSPLHLCSTALKSLALRYLFIERQAGSRAWRALRYVIAVIGCTTGLCRLSRRRRLRQRIVLLAYHRVADGDDPLRLNVSPRRFRAHMRYLARHTRPVPLDTIADALAGDVPIPDAGSAVTFDDGYRGDLPALREALLAHHVPAAIYVAPGLAQQSDTAWWEQLTILLRRAADGGCRLSAGDAGPSIPLRSRCVRHICTRSFAAALRPLGAEERRRVLADMARAAGFDTVPAVPPDTFLNPAERRQLRQEAGVTIGSHSQHHVPLGEDPDLFHAELRQSRAALADRAQPPVRHFAYPAGSNMHTSPEREQRLKAEGFRTAAVNRPGITGPDANPYELRRIGMANEPLPIFAAQASGMFEFLKRVLARTSP